MLKISSRFGRKSVIVASAGLFLALSFSYGFMAAKFRLFPHDIIAAAAGIFSSQGDGLTDTFKTSRIEFEERTYNRDGTLGLQGWGGALENVGDVAIGVDRRGQFFSYDGNERVALLQIHLETGEDELLRYASGLGIERGPWGPAGFYFRVLDLLALKSPDDITFIVSHNYWNHEQKGKTSRISRLTLAQPKADAVLGGTDTVEESDWEVIYETHPLLPFDSNPLADFNHDHSGGRMIIDESGRLIVGFGDQQENYEDSVEPFRPQDDSTSYGKFLRIDLTTLEVKVLAKGTRNPQGLAIDSDGNIWSTEHGPTGGDELNIIRDGANYGWPYETYGTLFPLPIWPLSSQQGRHLQFEKPVFAWVPSIGVSNLIQVQDVPSEWDGDLLISSLRATRLFRIRLDGSRVVFEEPIPIGYRIRDLVQMSNGRFLLWTDSGRLIELRVH